MASINRAIRYLLHNRIQFVDSCIKNLGFLFPDKIYLTLRYRLKMGKWINWKDPKTFTEKIQWLKVNAVRPEYTNMVDKLAVKRYVASTIGERYLIPTIGIWNSIDEIDWQSLPKQFVLKTTHGGGGCGVVVCKDIDSFDMTAAKQKLRISMAGVVGKEFREYPYYNVPRKIFAEQYMMDKSDDFANSDLIDYKFYCFNGEPIYCQVIRNRHIKEAIDFYDMKWNLMPFVGLNPKCSNGVNKLEKPACLTEMIEICRKLSQDIPFARVDLYNIDNKPYFGEITFYPAGGFGVFTPNEWDYKLGQLIKL